MTDVQKTGPDLASLFAAAVLLHDDGQIDAAILQQLGISRRTLARRKTYPELQLLRQAVAAYGLRRG